MTSGDSTTTGVGWLNKRIGTKLDGRLVELFRPNKPDSAVKIAENTYRSALASCIIASRQLAAVTPIHSRKIPTGGVIPVMPNTMGSNQDDRDRESQQDEPQILERWFFISDEPDKEV